jgi:hypothetical protein
MCVACWAGSSYAQDGGVGNHVPAKTQIMTNPNTVLTAVNCTYNSSGVSTDPDCNAFAGQEVQEYFAGYDQFGIPMNSYQVTLTFGSGNPDGTYVGCNLPNILPAFSLANCLAPGGVPIPDGGGTITLTFDEGLLGTGVTCIDSSTGADAPTDGGAANQACLSYSKNAFAQDIATGGAAGLPYLALPQSSGPCVLPPLSPLAVCGPNSFVLGIGVFCIPGNESCNSSGSGEGTFATESLPAYADVLADPSLVPEPPTLLLVGAAMFGMSMLLMKKKTIRA